MTVSHQLILCFSDTEKAYGAISKVKFFPVRLFSSENIPWSRASFVTFVIESMYFDWLKRSDLFLGR